MSRRWSCWSGNRSCSQYTAKLYSLSRLLRLHKLHTCRFHLSKLQKQPCTKKVKVKSEHTFRRWMTLKLNFLWPESIYTCIQCRVINMTASFCSCYVLASITNHRRAEEKAKLSHFPNYFWNIWRSEGQILLHTTPARLTSGNSSAEGEQQHWETLEETVIAGLHQFI